MKFDDFLSAVGELGPYQRGVYTLLSLPAVYNAVITILLVVFIFAVPEHRCAIPGLNNDTYQIQDEAHAHLINVTIPTIYDNQGNSKLSSCEVYSGLKSAIFRNETEQCSVWVYDKEVFVSTMAESMNFVCQRKPFTTYAKMLSMIGHLLGVLVSGPLSDMFGRRTVLIAGLSVAVVFSISLTWVTSFNLLIPVVILIASGFNTSYLASFVYSMEIVGPSKRMLTGVALNLFWSAGNMIVVLATFLLRDWKTRQLVVAVPGILFAYLYFVPESPRWLLCKCRRKEAQKTLENMANRNKTVLSPGVFGTVDAADETNKEPFWRILKSPTLMRRLAILSYNWFAIGMGFYGLSMNVTNLSGNIYLNFLLFVIVEACAYVICLLLLDRQGRKRMLCGAMLLAGITCTLTFIPVLVSDRPEQWIINILACLGNTCVSAGFAAVYVFSAELLPTTSRNSGMGLCSVICRVGSLISPYISDLSIHLTGRYSKIMPMLIFGAVTALAGLLVLLLPETLKKRLPENIKDAEKLGTKAYDVQSSKRDHENKLMETSMNGDKESEYDSH